MTTTLSLSSVVQRDNDLFVANIDDELVTMSVEKGQYYGITGIGTRIWELMEEAMPIEHIIDTISQEYAVDRQQSTQDAIAFIRDMVDVGLVHVIDA